MNHDWLSGRYVKYTANFIWRKKSALIQAAIPWLALAIIGRMIVRYYSDMGRTGAAFMYHPSYGLNYLSRSMEYGLPPLAWLGHGIFVLALGLMTADILAIYLNKKPTIRQYVLVPLFLLSISFSVTLSIYGGRLLIDQEMKQMASIAGQEHDQYEMPDRPESASTFQMARTMSKAAPHMVATLFLFYLSIIFPSTAFVIWVVYIAKYAPLLFNFVKRDPPYILIKKAMPTLRDLTASLIILECLSLPFAGLSEIMQPVLGRYGSTSIWAVAYSLKWFFIMSMLVIYLSQRADAENASALKSE